MRVGNKSISRFLSQSDMTFIIPVYQRNYDWETSQCKQLINDIESIIKTDLTHFIGTVCIKSNGRNESVIIDGQQRITTILIIFKVLLDLSSDLHFKRKIKNRYLIDEFAMDGLKLKLKPIKKDEDVFRKLLFTEDFKENDYDIIERQSHIFCNYKFIKSEIESKINKFHYTVEDFEDALSRLELVELELENENPQIIFESLNSTGLDLSDSDLLRNYLLMSLNYKDQERLYNNYWSKIENNLNNNPKILEDFLVHYLITKKRSNSTLYKGKRAQITNNKLYASFKRDYPYIDRNNMCEVESCFKEILRYSDYYTHFLFDETTVRENLKNGDKLFYDLIYSLNSKDSVIILMYLLDRMDSGDIDAKTMFECVQALISMSVRANVCDKVGLSKQFVALMTQKLDNWDKKSNFTELFWKVLTMGNGSYSFASDSEFMYSLKTIPLYTSLGSRKIKYMLYMLEKNNNPEGAIQYSDGFVEHIMPQTLSDKWVRYLKSKSDYGSYTSHVHLLGNLTLLGSKVEMSTGLLDENKEIYEDSNYSLTRQLKEYKNWTSKEIDSRGNDLIMRCLKIWSLPQQYNRSQGPNLGVVYDLNADFNLFTGTKPLEVTFLGGTTSVTNWSDLVMSVVTDCYEMDKGIFIRLLNYKGFYRNKTYINQTGYNMNKPIEILNSGIYVDVGNSVVSNLRFLKSVLEFFDNSIDSDLLHDVSFSLSKI